MALFRLVVRKAINISGAVYKWSNIYFVDRASAQDAAATMGPAVWNRERGFHSTDAFAYEAYASDLVPNTSNYAIVPITANQHGLWSASGDLLPSFCALRVDITISGPSRPSRKFYRIPLRETDWTGSGISTGLAAAVDSGVASLVALPELRDESGNQVSSFVVRNVTSRRLGRHASEDVPTNPGV